MLDAVEHGDRAAGGLLYDRLIDAVDGTLCRIVGRRGDDHDDLVQSAFEQILLSITRRRFARRCSLSSWAVRIAMNVGLNAVRSRQRERRVLERRLELTDVEELHATADEPERQLAARSELDRLRAHLAAMDERRATAVVLHDALGHKLAEVATLSGVSVRAAQSRLVRGRRELYRRMADDDAAEGT